MNKSQRLSLGIFTIFSSIIALILAAILFSNNLFNSVIALLVNLSNQQVAKSFTITFLILFSLVAIWVFAINILGSHLRRVCVSDNSMGTVDISSDAIESIALNAANASQSGVKTAKAHITADKAGKLVINLVVMAYSDVELPAMMSKVQERVKKDIERYTGIEVAKVDVKVSRVDIIAARVER